MNLMDLGVRYLAFKPGKYNVPMYNYIEPDSDAILEDMFAAGIFGMSSMARMHSANMTIKAAEDEKTGVVGGLIRSLFPSAESMREKFPYLKKHSYLLPVAYMQRIIKFIKNRDEQSDQSGKTVIELGRERTALLKKYGIVR